VKQIIDRRARGENRHMNTTELVSELRGGAGVFAFQQAFDRASPSAHTRAVAEYSEDPSVLLSDRREESVDDRRLCPEQLLERTAGEAFGGGLANHQIQQDRMTRQIASEDGVQADAVPGGLAGLLEKDFRRCTGSFLASRQGAKGVFEACPGRNAEADQVVGVADAGIVHRLDAGEDRALELGQSNHQTSGKIGSCGHRCAVRGRDTFLRFERWRFCRVSFVGICFVGFTQQTFPSRQDRADAA
jgi:hypothetical protein